MSAIAIYQQLRHDTLPVLGSSRFVLAVPLVTGLPITVVTLSCWHPKVIISDNEQDTFLKG